jgi:hypothetical protein
MTKRTKADRQAKLATPVEPIVEPRILEDLSTPVVDAEEAAAIAEIDAQIALPRSVVQRKYKLRYKARAAEHGQRGKAAKRSAWDWLAQELAAATLTPKAKLRVDDFLALLEANGVDHSRWTNRAPGWEGRLRMTGRLALQRVVAETGLLRFPDGEWKEAPADWIAKYSNV